MRCTVFALVCMEFLFCSTPHAQEAMPLSILPADVVELALTSGEATAKSLCDVDYGGTAMTRLRASKLARKIEGFNSRMDNEDKVAGATETRQLAGYFGQTSISAFVRQDQKVKTELVRLLSSWARDGALLASASCVKNGSLSGSTKCGEWRRKDGQDLSSMKDATFSTFLAVGIARSYLLTLRDHDREGLAAEHLAIENWIFSGVAKRLKKPSQVYFGLNIGWYWPTINIAAAQGRTEVARKLTSRGLAGLTGLIAEDGSIKDRTTRGNRALWYHYTSIGEIVMTMELARALQVPIPARLEGRLHKAVDLFVRAVDDHKAIDKWARGAHNSVYDGRQEFRTDWWNYDFAGTWLHVYPFRYPESPNAARFDNELVKAGESATVDTDFGVGVGCLYDAAGSSRQ